MRLSDLIAAASIWLATHVTADNFTSQVDEILSRPTFADATVGVKVTELGSGEVIYTTQEQAPLIPASNQKLLMSTVALAKLGLDFTYETTVFGSRPIDKKGVLNGDLWIVGSGDPSLNSDRLASVAESLVAKGLKKITGKVYADGTIFDDKFLGEGWDPDDEPFYYSAQVAGLNCDLNVVKVNVAPGASVGDPAVVRISGVPEAEERYVDIQSTVKTIASGGQESVVFDRTLGTNTIILGGSIPQGAGSVTLTVTIDNPNAFTAYRLAVALSNAGVKVSRTPTKPGKLPRKSTHLASSTSEPVSSLLKLFLKPSDNMYGEALLKKVGREADPSRPGTAASGANVVKTYLAEENIDATGVKTIDGSGLSDLNTVTARFINDLLIHNKNTFSEAEWSAWFDALPIAGVDGTLASRLVGTPAAGHIHAKTGSLSGVSSLSGYLDAADGTEYVFSILMNGFTSTTEARQAQDDIALALYLR
ncbi:hypothetical protein jhhlp_000506 [Lomentospora prolificans]|uniref:D-alanyl-D-alanine carboxypeptidase/D-alanyl-D-alanine-endopeptidase n=1 Tax=Lomentospora prolificans TaxID=41688 RepID=A0A2N3NL47_9PEZI|nr:hypothetical protein jhhlp_000506 [Lomentospora prolificans]